MIRTASGNCARCGEPFAREVYTPAPVLYCSDVCRRQARIARTARRRRHAMLAAEGRCLTGKWLTFPTIEAADEHARREFPDDPDMHGYVCGPPYGCGGIHIGHASKHPEGR